MIPNKIRPNLTLKVVILYALLVIVLVIWFFFLAPHNASAATKQPLIERTPSVYWDIAYPRIVGRDPAPLGHFDTVQGDAVLYDGVQYAPQFDGWVEVSGTCSPKASFYDGVNIKILINSRPVPSSFVVFFPAEPFTIDIWFTSDDPQLVGVRVQCSIVMRELR